MPNVKTVSYFQITVTHRFSFNACSDCADPSALDHG